MCHDVAMRTKWINFKAKLPYYKLADLILINEIIPVYWITNIANFKLKL